MIIQIDGKIYDYEDDSKDWGKDGHGELKNGLTYVAPDDVGDYRLSKSRFCSGVQCPKMLWLKKNRPELFDDSVINEAVVATGNDVGDLAMGLLGDYTEVPYDKDVSKMLIATEMLLKNGVENIAEASFSYKGLFCSIDILKNKGNNHFEIYEVKCATSVHPQYVPDLAFQYYLIKQFGYEVDKACLVHINNEYIRQGDIDIHQLFVIEDLTRDAEDLYEMVDRTITSLREYLKQTEEPNKEIGECCLKPYCCGFWKHCTEHLPKPNLFDLSGTFTKNKWKLYDSGHVSFEELLNVVSDKARLQVEHELYDIPPHIDVSAISDFLNGLTYPLYFLDFESFFPAIPRYDNSKPYGQICFQYSLHYIEEEDGELKHKEFLAYPGKDPRRALAESLCRDIPMGVCTLAYNMTFERLRISEMAELFSDLSEHLMSIHDNMKDLIVPFRGRQYYCRDMKGSYSIKYVLPALFPDDPALDYHNLEGVHNGGEAANTFLRMEKMSPEELEEYRGYLLKYCGLDTYAMVKIWESLKAVTAPFLS